MTLPVLGFWLSGQPRSRRRVAPRRRPSRRLALEPLERRDLPSFYQGGDYPVGNTPYAVAVGDVNGDGIPDVVTANHGTLTVLLGNAHGTFERAINSPFPFPDGSPIAVGDINGDGRADVVVGGDSEVGILLSNGNGTFRQGETIPLFGVVSSLTLADVDHDGFPDIVLASYLARQGTTYYSVQVFVNQPGEPGTFSEWHEYPIGMFPSALFVPGSVTVGKFYTEVEDPDIAVSYTVLPRPPRLDPDYAIETLEGLGDGMFAPARFGWGASRVYDTVLGPAGDFNHDGVDDLVLGDNGTVGVLLGQGDGTFADPRGLFYSVGDVRAIAVGDFNHDGNLDVATANAGSNTVAVLLGNGEGTLQAPTFYPVGSNPVAIAVRDFCGDGYPDLVTANAGGNSVSLLVNAEDWDMLAPPSSGGQGPAAHTPEWSSIPAASAVAPTSPAGQDVPQPPVAGTAEVVAWERWEKHAPLLQGSILPFTDPWEVQVVFSPDQDFFVRGAALQVGR